MKDKVLRSNITKKIESLCRELRSYSGDSMVCNITIISRASGAAEKDDIIPDWYSARVVPVEGVDQDDSILNSQALIYYGPDEFGNEGIIKVVPYKEEKGEEEDGP